MSLMDRLLADSPALKAEIRATERTIRADPALRDLYLEWLHFVFFGVAHVECPQKGRPAGDTAECPCWKYRQGDA